MANLPRFAKLLIAGETWLMFSVRTLTPTDYPALLNLFAEHYPDWPLSVERIRRTEEGFPSHVFREHWIAEEESEVLGAALLTQNQLFFNPRQFYLNIWVHEQKQKKGVGSALYAAIKKQLEGRDLEFLLCSVPERFQAGRKFLERRGFSESYRSFQSKLELSKFNPEPYSGLEAKLLKRGIRLMKLAEVSGSNPRQRIYELQKAIDRAIPGSELRTLTSYEEFWAHVEKEGHDGVFYVAAKDDLLVGLHFGSAAPGSEWFEVSLTGVLPEFQRYGIATALKARGMLYAKIRGYKIASTWSDSRNQKMLALNQKFGFERQPASISYIWRP